ncbi:hypothetical protein KUTeg_009967 [Tegillarca granosa]|uniref:Uncharacterized protein n=1 Tax=Tegillarca granosa TaxID=220873 RepID=A0ABQ9F5D8_TEGGR|nr:hypothetical protein KUTeg_009967 [Tegillarca granosa]
MISSYALTQLKFTLNTRIVKKTRNSPIILKVNLKVLGNLIRNCFMYWFMKDFKIVQSFNRICWFCHVTNIDLLFLGMEQSM